MEDENILHHKMAAGFSDGSVSTFVLSEDDTVQADQKWEETRFRAEHRYVGLAISERFVLAISLLLPFVLFIYFSEESFHAALMARCD
jgi:hypothetical protein